MMILGIDPGQKGAIAWKDDEGRVAVDKMPEGMTEIWDYFDLTMMLDPIKTRAHIEDVGGYRKGNSATAAVKFARHCGHIEMALYAAGIPTYRVSPNTWMRDIGVPPNLKKGMRKNWIKDRMQRMYPHIKVTLQNADALGILTYSL